MGGGGARACMPGNASEMFSASEQKVVFGHGCHGRRCRLSFCVAMPTPFHRRFCVAMPATSRENMEEGNLWRGRCRGNLRLLAAECMLRASGRNACWAPGQARSALYLVICAHC